MLKNHQLFIPKDSRICKHHNEFGTWDDFVTTFFEYSTNQIEDLIDLLMKDSGYVAQKTDAEMKLSTGLTNEQLQVLLSSLPTLIARYSDIKMARTVLSIYLNRLRTGHSFNTIGKDFGVSRFTVSNYISIAREALSNDFVPNHLGFTHFTRQQLIECNTQMSRSLYGGERATIILDGTYLYCDKSGNHFNQKSTFSGQKKRNLVKPMVCVAPDGTYVDIFGPYSGTANDAKIMEIVFQNHSTEMMNVLRKDDIVLVDRGFRDCVSLFTAHGLIVKMPEFVQKDDLTGQLTAKKANKSRLVTASRFVIESRNGHIKTIWHLFDTRLSSYDLVHIMDDYRIGAALINRFWNKIEPNKNDAIDIANRMINLVSTPNDLATIVNSAQFQKEIRHFTQGDEAEQIFPALSKEDLKKISLGSYQIAQMNAYCVEHMRSCEDGAFDFYICPENIGAKYFGDFVRKHGVAEPILILAQLGSRFRSKVKYRTFVFVDMSISGPEAVVGYCCECRHGLRTVSCCCHIMTLIGYLAYTRHNLHTLKETAAFLNGLFEE